MASTRSHAGESLHFFNASGAAEGATAPETLRQKDRDRVMNFWKAKQRELFPPKG
jgi:hypothetical protein